MGSPILGAFWLDENLYWEDHWLPLPYSFKPYSLVMEGTKYMKVTELIDPETKEWMTDILEELFSQEEAKMIAGIPISIQGMEDRWV